MNEYEKNVYKNIFEYPTKKIVELELENQRLNNVLNETIEDLRFCLMSVTQEKILSNDSRTHQEMISCEQILKERIELLNELKESDK